MDQNEHLEDIQRRSPSCSTWIIMRSSIEQRTSLLLFCLCLAIAQSDGSDFFTADDPRTGTLLKMVTDKQTGRVYIGAVNRLYQLTADLRLERSVETGPRQDNAMCPPPPSECQCEGQNCREFQKVSMNSISKTLVIDYRGERLIACSNLFQV